MSGQSPPQGGDGQGKMTQMVSLMSSDQTNYDGPTDGR